MNLEQKIQDIGYSSIKRFVGYCDGHSQTAHATFSKKEVTYMLRLAGSPKTWDRPHDIEFGKIEWYTLREEMGDLVAKYRFITCQIEKATTFKELLQVAKGIIALSHESLGIVSGPITTGGKGSVKENILALQEYIEELYEAGENIFDQMIFHEAMIRITNKETEYDHNLLEDFYLPIFKSKSIKKMFFMKNYKTSTGAKWEHKKVSRMKFIQRIYQK